MKQAFTMVLLALISVVSAQRVVIRIPDPGIPGYEQMLHQGADLALYQPGEFLDLIVSVDQLPQFRMLYPSLIVTQNEMEQKQFLSNADRDIPGYHSYDAMILELYQLAATHPSLMQVEVIGKGWGKSYALQGIPAYMDYAHEIYAVKLSDNVSTTEDEAQFLFAGGHHAREPLSVEICMGIIHHLLDGYGVDPQITAILDHSEIWVVPLINPDGHKIVLDQTNIWWRKNLNDNNGNMQIDASPATEDGVDINRNYAYRWGNVGASDDPSQDTYHGLEPFSEPEAQAMRDFVQSKQFLGSINYHTYGQYVLFPFGFAFDVCGPDRQEQQWLAQTMAASIAGTGANTYTPMPAHQLYPVSGSAEDWLHGVGGSFAFTVEAALQFIIPGSEVGPQVQNQLTAAKILMQRVNYKCLRGHVYEAGSGVPLRAKLYIEGIDNHIPERAAVYSRQDFGSYYRFLPVGSYEMVVSAPGYLPQRRNVTISHTSATVQDFRLHPAQYINAAFQITNQNGSPLAGAMLQLGERQASTDAQGFAYIPNLTGGLYQVKASHPGYSSYRAELELLPGFNVIRLSDQPMITEDFEVPLEAWSLTGNWALVAGDAPQGDSCLGDNPSGQSAANQYAFATYNYPISLEGAQDVNLQFWARRDLVQYNLYVALQYRLQGEADWLTMQVFMGESDWEHYDIDLSFLAGREIELRFLKYSQFNTTENTFWLDGLRLYVDGTYSSTEDVAQPMLDLRVGPNPFKNEVKISMEGCTKAPIKLDIFNIKGQKVRSWQTKTLTDQPIQVSWDGRDAGGRKLAAGIYFLRASGGDRKPRIRKMIKIN